MPELDKNFANSKIDKVHRGKGNKCGPILPIVGKFSD